MIATIAYKVSGRQEETLSTTVQIKRRRNREPGGK